MVVCIVWVDHRPPNFERVGAVEDANGFVCEDGEGGGGVRGLAWALFMAQGRKL